MRYVILQCAVSIDGYIARLDGTVDFLDNMDSASTQMFQEFLNTIDTIIMGSNTYEVMLRFGDIPFTDKRIIVFTKRTFKKQYPHVEFIDQDVVDTVKQLDGNVWLFGGAKLFQTCMEHDIVDEYQIHIVPHLIGSGIPLFLHQSNSTKLSLLDVKRISDNVLVTYRRGNNE